MICTLHHRHRCDMQGEFSLQQLLDGAASHAQSVRIKGLLQLPPLAVAGMGSATLLDPAAPRRESKEWKGRMREYWVWPHDRHFIWGATATILVALAQALREG